MTTSSFINKLSRRFCKSRYIHEVTGAPPLPGLTLMAPPKFPLQFGVKKNLRGFGPLANYADRATAASWPSSTNFSG
jgi:hypothetical protein